jgi:hypothetical protein
MYLLSTNEPGSINCNNRIALVNTFRKLWEQHDLWTRSFIISDAENLKDLTAHLTIAADLVNAAKAGNTESVNTIRTKWYKNAEDIADFLSSINPYWSKNQWRNLLFDHLKLVENEATLRLNKDYAKDIALYDAIEDESLMMADYMSDGIAKQFKI